MKFEAKKFLRVPVTAALAAAALGMAVPAISLADSAPATAVVQVSDLNLATTRGKNKLERRTASAISSVCPLRDSAIGPRTRTLAAHNECAEAVRASVKEQLAERGGHMVASN